MTTHTPQGPVGSVSELHTEDLHSDTHRACTSLTDVRLSTQDVAALAGTSFRQCDFWLRCGYIQAENDGQGSGSRRWFTLPQTRRVILIAWLVSGGLTPAQAVGLLDGDASFLLAAFPGGGE